MSQTVADETTTPVTGLPVTRRRRVRGWFGAHRPRSLWLNILLLLLLVLAVVLAFVTIANSGSTTTPVRTVAVTRATVTATVSGSGNTTSSTSTPASFQTAGTVTTVDVKAGDTVRLGQVLATIDPTAANATLRTALAQLASSKAAYAQAVSGPTAVKQQQDQFAITQAQQAVGNANATLAAAQNQLGLDQTSTNTAIDNAKTKLGNDQDSTGTAIDSAKATLDNDQGSLDRANTSYNNSCANAGYTPGTDPSTFATAATTNTTTTSTSTTGTAAATATVAPAAAATTSTQTASGQQACDTAYATYQNAQGAVTKDQLAVTTAEQNQGATLDTDQQAITTAEQNQAATLAKDNATITTNKQQVVMEQNSVNTAQLTAEADLHPETPAQIAQAKASVDSAQVPVDSARLTVAETTLLAPQAGVVLAVNGKVGESSSSGSSASTGSTSSTGTAASSASSASSSSSGFVTIANLSQLAVTANIAEADAAKIKLGQKTTITFPATGATTTGSVTQITPQDTVTNNVVLYPVQVSLDSAPTGVGVGATASLSITTGTAQNVLSAPTSAITTLGNRHTVTVHRADGDTVVPVDIGLSGDTTTEITGGAAEGDQLVLPTTAAGGTGTTTGGGFPRTGGG